MNLNQFNYEDHAKIWIANAFELGFAVKVENPDQQNWAWNHFL